MPVYSGRSDPTRHNLTSLTTHFGLNLRCSVQLKARLGRHSLLHINLDAFPGGMRKLLGFLSSDIQGAAPQWRPINLSPLKSTSKDFVDISPVELNISVYASNRRRNTTSSPISATSIIMEQYSDMNMTTAVLIPGDEDSHLNVVSPQTRGSSANLICVEIRLKIILELSSTDKRRQRKEIFPFRFLSPGGSGSLSHGYRPLASCHVPQICTQRERTRGGNTTPADIFATEFIQGGGRGERKG